MALRCIALRHASSISAQLSSSTYVPDWLALWVSHLKSSSVCDYISRLTAMTSCEQQGGLSCVDFCCFSRPRIIFTFHPAESLQRRLWPPSYASFVCARVNRLFNSAKHRRGSALNAAGQSSLLAGASVK